MTILINNSDLDLNESLRLPDNLFEEALNAYENGEYKDCSEKVNVAHRIYLQANKTEKISICLTFIGLMKYLCDPETYKSSLLLLEDARFLAQDVCGENAWGISKWAFAQISMHEHNYNEASMYLNRAAYMVTEYPYILMRIYESLAFCNLKIKNYERAYECTAKAKELAENGGYNQAY